MPITEFKKLSEYGNDQLATIFGLNAAGVNKKQKFFFRVNVKDYGAIGDGVANDTDAVQAAINAVLNAGTGEVYFPPGIFLCNVTLTNPGRVTLTGVKDCGGFDDWNSGFVDAAESVLKPWAPTSPVIAVPYPTATVIQNLRLRGPGAYTSGSLGLQLAIDNAGTFGGTGATLRGVAINDFDVCLLVGTNRAIFEHCSFLGGTYCVLATGAGLPADTLTFIGCSCGGAKLTGVGVRQAPGARTNTAYHLTGGLKGVNWIGCETGQCGLAFYLNGGFFNLQGSNIEGADLGNIIVLDGRLTAVASREMNGTHPFVEVRGAGATANLIGNLGAAVCRNWGGNRRLWQLPKYPIDFYLSDGSALVGKQESDGMFMGAQLTVAQVIASGDSITEVVFNSRDSDDPIEGDATNSNYGITTGRWLCVVDGVYTFRFALSVSKVTDFCTVYLQERIGASIVGDFTLASHEDTDDGHIITGFFVRQCFQGRTYSLAINSVTAGALTINPGSSPNTGKPISRLMITLEH